MKEEAAFQRLIGHICCPVSDPRSVQVLFDNMTKRDSYLWGPRVPSKYKLPLAPSSNELGSPDMNLGFIYHYKNKLAGEREEISRRQEGRKSMLIPLSCSETDSPPSGSQFHYLVFMCFLKGKPKDITVIGSCGLWGWCLGSWMPAICI